MAWLRVDTAHLLPWIRRSLTGLLRTLGPTQWGAPTVCGDWTVGDIAAHLLAVELGNVSQRRDAAHARQSDPDGDLSPGEWLATFDDQWVVAARRLSPRVLVDMLDLAGIWFEDHVSGLRLDGMGPPVGWAMPQPAPLWMDIAHEYTQRWVYQQRIRDVVGEPGLLEPTYQAPAIATNVNSQRVVAPGAGRRGLGPARGSAPHGERLRDADRRERLAGVHGPPLGHRPRSQGRRRPGRGGRPPPGHDDLAG
jgi:hypothetical protein